MKKKVVIIIWILLTIGLVLFLENIYKINFIENINKVMKNKEKSNSELGDITTIDVTDLDGSITIDHLHTFKTMYDENNHWEECTICGEIEEQSKHEIQKVWAFGKESCYVENYATNTCNKCGYSFIDYAPCTWNGKYDCSSYFDYKICSSTTHGRHYIRMNPIERCYTSNGTKLDCFHGGRCVKCNAYYDVGMHLLNNYIDLDKMKCRLCGKEYGTVTYTVRKIPNTLPIEYTIDSTYKFNSEVAYKGVTNPMLNHSSTFDIASLELVDKKSNSEFTIRTTIKYKDVIKTAYDKYFAYYVTINNKTIEVQDYIFRLDLVPDDAPPVIESITMKNSEDLTEWSRTKPISISGTENYCKNLKVKILDDKDNIIFEGETIADNNGVYSISCTPDVECDTNGRTFKVIVTDTCENSAEKEFTISKVDNVSPKPTSDTNITGSWSKLRRFTFKAIDSGIGNVSIAFDNIEDLNKAILNENNEYIREYEFIGDVYNPKELPVLYQDGLGNMCMQKVTIDKLDNTAPTIINSSIHNNILTLESHDRHERLGEGSGVVKYKYITSNEKLEKPIISNENGIEVKVDEKIVIDKIYEVKYVYVIAEDLVGNISDVYEVKIPELVLISSVNLDNEKGSVILEWSDYDISDKYFAIYRREENADTWDIIIGLDKKFNASSFIDTFAVDKEAPNIPNINITGNIDDNNIKINASSSDGGNKYEYYIEAYNSSNLELLAVSN